MNRLMRILGWLVVCLSTVSCSDKSTNQIIMPDTSSLEYRLNKTPYPDSTIEDMATYVVNFNLDSHLVVAPECLYQRIEFFYNHLKLKYDSVLVDTIAGYPVDSLISRIGFKPRIHVGMLVIKFSDSALIQFDSGNYHDWDSLNNLFKLDSINSRIDNYGTRYVRLFFAGRLDPFVVSDYYQNLPGVEWVGPNYRTIGYSNCYPWMIDGKVTMLVRSSWNNGLNLKYWYFKEVQDCVSLVGFFNPQDGWPDWWLEAKQAEDVYYSIIP